MFRCQGCGAINRLAPGREGQPVCGRCKGVLDVSGAPQEVDHAAFLAAIQSSPVPVVVDFWAPWCGPCRAIAPVLDRLARERAGLALVLKVNTDDQQQLAASLGIRAIPTFIAFRGGQEIGRESGMMTAALLDGWIGHWPAQSV